jgi:hypothetical protein
MQMRTSHTRSAVAVLAAATLAAALSACGSDSSVAPTNEKLDVAALVASSSGASYNAGARSLATLPNTNTTPSVDPALCPFSAANQLFECAPVTRNGLTFKTAYALLDGSGHSLSQRVASSVASIHTLIDINGTTTVTAGNASTAITLNSHSDHTLSGLLTDTRVLNGTSTEHDTTATTIGGSTTHTAIDATTTTANLEIPRASGEWPATGTITTDVKTKSSLRVGELTTSIRAVTTFNGTSTVTTALTIGGHTTTCKLDLSGKVAPACS